MCEGRVRRRRRNKKKRNRKRNRKRKRGLFFFLGEARRFDTFGKVNAPRRAAQGSLRLPARRGME